MTTKIIAIVLMTIFWGCITGSVCAPTSTAVDWWDRMYSRQSDLMYKYNSFFTDPTKYTKYSNPWSTINQRYYPTTSELTYRYTMPATNPHYITEPNLASDYVDMVPPSYTTYRYTMPSTNLKYVTLPDLRHRYTDMLPSSWDQRYNPPPLKQTSNYIHRPIINQRYTFLGYEDFKPIAMLPPPQAPSYGLPSFKQRQACMLDPIKSQRYDLPSIHQRLEHLDMHTRLNSEHMDVRTRSSGSLQAPQLPNTRGVPATQGVSRPNRSDFSNLFKKTYAPSLVSSVGQDVLRKNVMSLSPVPQMVGRSLIYLGTALSVYDFMDRMHTYSQIGHGKLSYRELLSDPLVWHLAWAVDQLGGGYLPSTETISYSRTIETKFTSMEESRVTHIERFSTAPGLIGRFGFDPHTDSYVITSTYHSITHVSQGVPGASYQTIKPTNIGTLSPETQQLFGDMFQRGDAARMQVSEYLSSLRSPSLDNWLNQTSPMLDLSSLLSSSSFNPLQNVWLSSDIYRFHTSYWMDYGYNTYSPYGWSRWSNYNYGYNWGH